jgi:adenine-specific DNA methylase
MEAHDWEHLASDTRYLTHSIHRYSGKFIPQIARQAIELISNPGDIVLDSYCGSGTTLLEAALSGRSAIGTDLNPLAVLISRVKTTPVSAEELAHLVRDAERVAASISEDGQFALYEAEAEDLSGRLEDPWFQKWFGRPRLLELLAFDKMAREQRDQRLRDVALLALSDVLRRASFANSSYPNVMFDKRKPVPASIVRFYVKRLTEICAAVGQLGSAVPAGTSIQVIQGDARSVPIPGESVHAIVTHPPYIGSIPYAEYGTLSINWLGYSSKNLDAALTGGRRQTRDVVSRFEEAFGEMLTEAYRVLVPGGKAFLMVGNPTVKGELIDLTDMTINLARTAGFALVEQVHRTGGNRRANKMQGEDLLLFSKGAL